jgi:hypothetical protein
MRVFVFISTRDRELIGFTADQEGANLPPGYGPWRSAAEGGAVLLNGGDADPVTEAVTRDGFFLAVGGYEDEPPIIASIH